MGIDPVTHTPRLDLLELSSLLNSTLYNSHQLSYLLNNNPNNYNQQLGNMAPPLVNQNLITLASALLSNQPKITPQNVHENQLYDSNNNNFPQNDQFQYSLPSLNETQFMQSKMEQLSQTHHHHHESLDPLNQALITSETSTFAPMGISNGYNHQEISAQSNSSAENYHQGFGYSGTNGVIGLNNMNMIPNMRFSSLLSTPSSSSPNTYNVNSSTTTTTTHEDERDTFCSNILMYHDIANALNGNDLM